MSAAEVALGGLLLAVATAAGGYVVGNGHGKAAEVARKDAGTVKAMGEQLAAHADLVKQSGAASQRIRQALVLRLQANDQSTKEMGDALTATADSRAGCVFPAGVMRSLADARDRAAQAAASGVGSALPAATNGATAER